MTKINSKDIVEQIHQQWAAHFMPLNAQALSELYAKDAVLFGSMVEPYIGRDAVKAYFSSLPPGRYIGAAFFAEHIVPLTEDVISMAGSVIFQRHELPPLELRITHIFVRQHHQWLIASHHVSPKVVL